MHRITVHFPDPERLEEADWRAYAHTPVLFADGTRYLDEPNEYLRALRDGKWPLTTKRKHTPTSLKNSAFYLVNFLRWCAEVGIDWREIQGSSLDDPDDSYAKQQLDGKWAQKERELSVGTVNQRVDEAVRFLEWAAWRQYRQAFYIDKVVKRYWKQGSGDHSYGKDQMESTEGRANKVRATPEELDLPSREDWGRFSDAFSAHAGYTCSLMEKLIRLAGIRVSECLEWRIDTLPKDRSRWKITKKETVRVRIRAGVKGEKKLDEESRPVLHPVGRLIHFPLSLAEELHAYAWGFNKNLRRAKARAIYLLAKDVPKEQRSQEIQKRMKKDKKQPPLQLFLNENTGRRWKYGTFSKHWRNCPYQPIEGWSPHLARHAYACYFILQDIENRAKLISQLDERTALQVAASSDLFTVWTVLQRQFGHVDKKTTELYTVWLANAAGTANLKLQYFEDLEKASEKLSVSLAGEEEITEAAIV